MSSKPGRRLIPWMDYAETEVAKATAGYIYCVLEITGEAALATKFNELYPKATEKIFGKAISREQLNDFVREKTATKGRTGLEVTDHKIYDRGHKTDYAKECTNYDAAVRAALLGESMEGLLPDPILHDQLDPLRSFSDDMVLFALHLQGWLCAYCECNLDPERGALKGAVGDHMIAHSKGGRTVQNNCKATCQECNNRKSDQDVVDFLRNERIRQRAICRKV